MRAQYRRSGLYGYFRRPHECWHFIVTHQLRKSLLSYNMNIFRKCHWLIDHSLIAVMLIIGSISHIAPFLLRAADDFFRAAISAAVRARRAAAGITQRICFNLIRLCFMPLQYFVALIDKPSIDDDTVTIRDGMISRISWPSRIDQIRLAW